MFIALPNSWNSSHTDLTKYFIERLKQRVDFEEVISNRHKTTNGFTLIAEIVQVASLAQKRIKSINRLISLVQEAKSEVIDSSICNDYILQTYHPDIIDYYKKFSHNKLKESGKELSELLNKSKINFIRLQQQYYENILFEMGKIDFKSTDFNRHSIVIDKLVDCFIPFLLHNGYSVTSISDIAFRFIFKNKGDESPGRIIANFDGSLKPYIFLIQIKKGHLEFNDVLAYLDYRDIVYKEVSIKDIKPFLQDAFTHSDSDTYYIINHSTLDPHNFLRNIYEMGLKSHVATKDRISLQFFTNFFEGVYWRFTHRDFKFQKSNVIFDPINVLKRKSTLIDTLVSSSSSSGWSFGKDDKLPFINEIRDSLYYYNLALRSKSIENSLSLLWTSLETLLPYRLKDNDIENVQYFVSKSLSIGSIGREIISFTERLCLTHRLNENCFSSFGVFSNFVSYQPSTVKRYIEWLATDHSANDPYNVIKPISNLLCKQFCFLNDVYTGKHTRLNTAQYWLDKIKSSETSIMYQLDRIYLHRNQIVHSGKFINEYSNLWHHLEWYVGKLLAYCVIEFLQSTKEVFSKELAFMKLEADYDTLTNLLENYRDQRICDIQFAYNLIAKHSWQFS